MNNETMVTTFRSSGLTQQQFCDKHNISIERLRYYLYKKQKSKKPKSAQAAFITFTPQPPSVSCTIIHGQFTPSSLAALVKELTKS